jgi:hypothetical protein
MRFLGLVRRQYRRRIAIGFGMRMRGFLGAAGAAVTRAYHLHQLPLFSRRVRVLTDGVLSTMFRRDMTEMGLTEPRRPRP